MKALSTLSQLTMRRIYWRKSRVTILLRLPAYRWCSMLFLHCWICAAGDFYPGNGGEKDQPCCSRALPAQRSRLYQGRLLGGPGGYRSVQSSTDNPGGCGIQMRMVSFEGRILSGGAVDMTLVNGHVIWNGHTIQQKYGLPLEFCR